MVPQRFMRADSDTLDDTLHRNRLLLQQLLGVLDPLAQ